MSSGSWPEGVSTERRLRYTLEERLAETVRARRSSLRRASRQLHPGPSPTRIAIIASPRSGNTWLRMMLGYVLELEEVPIHHPGDLNWADLPERAVIQLHWSRSAYLQSLLEAARCRVITITRHPFDVLVSILRFAQTEPDTSEWLWGQGGDEEKILGADPSSEQFAEWALGERASALLEITNSWFGDQQLAYVSYETLLESPEEEMRRLLKRLSLQPNRPILEAVRTFTPGWVNERSGLAHAWMASTGTWKEVVPTQLVNTLRVRYRHQLRQLGITEIPGMDLDPAAARARWQELYPGPDSSLPEDGYRAEVQVLDPPSSVPARSRLYCLVKVHNQGTARWPDRLRHPLVRLGCRWLATDGSETVVLEDRHVLGGSIRPGTASYEKANFSTPPSPGVYLLQIDLVHERVRWFGSGPTIEVTVS